MMMFDLIIMLAGLVAFLGLVILILRKLPTLASIDTQSIPTERHNELKVKIAQDRLQRTLVTNMSKITAQCKPWLKRLSTMLRNQYHRLLALEQTYRSRVVKTETLTDEDRQKTHEQTGALVVQADEAFRRGDLETAESKAIEAIAVNPRLVAAYRMLANVYLEQREYVHARETLRFILERLHVEDDDVFAGLSRAASGEGNYTEAKRDIERSIALNSTVAGHYLDLCRVDMALGDSVAAFENCRRAVDLEPNNPKYLDALVEASIIAKKRQWAEDAYGRLKQVNPENQKLSEFAARIENIPAMPFVSRRKTSKTTE